jgi:L-malate glycosyltransferase
MGKRILVFAHDSSLYGASLSLLTFLENLSKNPSFEILVVLPNEGPMASKLNSSNIRYIIISFPRCISINTDRAKKKLFELFKYEWRSRLVMTRLVSATNNFNAELIYTNTSIVDIGFKLSKRLKVPHIWHVREFGLSGYGFVYLPSQNSIANKIMCSDISIFSSNTLRDFWVGSKKENSRVVYNGVCVRKHMPKKQLDLKNKIIFGLVGAILKGKGQDIAIRGFVKFLRDNPNSELHFFGDIIDKDYYKDIKQLIEHLKIFHKVRFFPFTDNVEIYKYIHILLSCSENEGFGRTIIEAMSWGIPVIANASGGPLEIIDDGKTGLLYEKTPESLSEKMVTLTFNKTLYDELVKNGLEKVKKDFSVEKYNNEIASILKSFK